MKVLSLFSGIGAFEKALKNINIKYDLIGFSEIDKHAIKSYCAVHNVDEDLNLGDITKVNEKELKDFDLMTWGFPCTDVSICGKQEGFVDGDGKQTRSGLYYEGIRILKEKKPKFSIIENVKNLTGKKFKNEFETVLRDLTETGYNNYWAILNAKDFGIPQNRERVFIVSIRRDIDDGNFKFPEGFPLKIRLKDILELEETVDERFYLGQKRIDKLKVQMALNKNNKDEPAIIRIDIPQTVRVRKYPVDNETLCKYLREHKAKTGLTNRQIAEKLEVPITMVEHWFRQDIYFAIPEAELWFQIKEVLEIITDEFDDAITIFEEREGVYEKSERHYFADGIMPTLTSTTAGKEKIITVGTIIDDTQGFDGVRYYNEYSPSLRASRSGLKTIDTEYRIRNLTPKEAWRLTGFADEDYEKAAKVCSSNQLFKQAGNSIVVNVLEAIFENLRPYLEKQKN